MPGRSKKPKLKTAYASEFVDNHRQYKTHWTKTYQLVLKTQYVQYLYLLRLHVS